MLPSPSLLPMLICRAGTLSLILEKVARVYGNPDHRGSHPEAEAARAPFHSKAIRFDSSPLIAPHGDPERLKKLWAASHRARYRGKVMTAGVALFLSSQERFVLFQLRLLFREDQEHDCDGAVHRITEHLKGEVTVERRYANPEHAALQMMEDSACNFLGMDDWTNVELFAAYFDSTKRCAPSRPTARCSKS